MLSIVEKENYIIKEMEKAHEKGCRIFICGGGTGARLLYTKACKSDGRDIDIEAFVLNDDYYDSVQMKTMMGKPVIPMRELDLEDPRVFVCVGYMHYDFYDTELVAPKMKGRFLSEDITFVMDKTGEGKLLDYDYITQNRSQFEDLAEQLSDEKSIRVLNSYLNQRISGKFEYLEKEREENQYFDSSIVDLMKYNFYIDCGAYNGDSYKAFLSNYEKNAGKRWMGEAWLWEANSENVQKIREVIDEEKNVHIVEKGVGKQKEIKYFSGFGSSGIVSSKQEGTPLAIDTIDNVVLSSGKHGLIKMDIEGSEYEALEGAKNLICNCKPDLAICVYHKRDDLLTIPKLIHSFYDKYKFYLRAYSRYSTEIVLYAIAE